VRAGPVERRDPPPDAPGPAPIPEQVRGGGKVAQRRACLPSASAPEVPDCADVREEAPIVLALSSVSPRRRSTSIRLAAAAPIAARAPSADPPTRGESTTRASYSLAQAPRRSIRAVTFLRGRDRRGRCLVSIGMTRRMPVTILCRATDRSYVRWRLWRSHGTRRRTVALRPGCLEGRL
jgi:hypothetical protein